MSGGGVLVVEMECYEWRWSASGGDGVLVVVVECYEWWWSASGGVL